MRYPRRVDLVKGLGFPAIAAVILAVSCSSRVDSPDALFARMVKAYGGKEKIGELTSFTGRGFMKKISSVQVADSYPFDIYQDGQLIKNRIVNVEGGRMIDVRILVIDKNESYQYSVSGGLSAINRWEKGLVKYRFPGMLEWIPGSGLKGELLKARAGETDYSLKYENGDEIVTYTIDGKTFLLKGTEVRNREDSTFVTVDLYGDYLRMDDTWFPSRFSGFFGGRQYYEYFLTRVDLGTKFPEGFFAVLPEDTAGVQYYTPPQQ
jgi:hypothetical protein